MSSSLPTIKNDAGYPPKVHIEKNIDKLLPLIEAFPFATIISQYQGSIQVTQAPLVIQRHHNHLFLIGHLAARNSHAQRLEQQEVQVIFHGPNAYISPNDYASKQLPTWNSLSVHIAGTCQTTQEPAELFAILETITKHFEEKNPSDKPPYQVNHDDEKTARLVHHIIGFTIKVNDIYGRYKVSKDKSAEDVKLAANKLKSIAAHNYDELIDHLII